MQLFSLVTCRNEDIAEPTVDVDDEESSENTVVAVDLQSLEPDADITSCSASDSKQTTSTQLEGWS